MKYKNSKELDMVVKEDYSKKIYFSGDDFSEKGHLVQTVTIPPNTKQREHWHDKQTEVFFILKGECHMFINAKEYLAKPWDAFICNAKDKHYLWNKSQEPFELAVFKHSVPDYDDTHWLV
jgi:quercetin dioxygenase-like cupin family protein